MAQPDDDLTQYLQSWPELLPDPLAMRRTALRMNSRMAALRAAPAETLGEPQFRMLLKACGSLAVLAYVAWPYISAFLAASPGFNFVLLCVVVLSLVAPLILLLLSGFRAGEMFLSEPNEGDRSC